jgi:hypothetical protein
MAQMAGRKTLDVPPISTWAPMTVQNLGDIAISSAPMASAATARPTSARFDRRESTNPPAGVWVRIPAMPPTVSASPTLSSFHL